LPKIRETLKDIQVKNCDMPKNEGYGMTLTGNYNQTGTQSTLKSIAMDFISELPVAEGMTPILVVIGRMTKMSNFIPCRKDLNIGVLPTLYEEVVGLHGLPHDIINDANGTLFT